MSRKQGPAKKFAAAVFLHTRYLEKPGLVRPLRRTKEASKKALTQLAKDLRGQA